MELNKTGIIIQVRMGSKRLPGKVLAPFYGDSSILGIIADRIVAKAEDTPVVIATSRLKGDDVIEKFASERDLLIYRGDENDVLSRYIEASDCFGFQYVIRICADNPFLDVEGTLELASLHCVSESDYTTYMLINELPAIKSHLGLWGEIVSMDALKKTAALTHERIYREHVTNYIYGNPHLFKVHFMPAPAIVFSRTDLRFTVDTAEDFLIAKELYNCLIQQGNGFSVSELVSAADRLPELKQRMHLQITRNIK